MNGMGEYHTQREQLPIIYETWKKDKDRQTDKWLVTYFPVRRITRQTAIIYIYFYYQIRKALEVVNFFLKLKGSNYKILLCNNFFLTNLFI